jgi:2'-5' RNA ligase
MSVGLFLPLPEKLASKFPSLGDHDTSPPHATLLYFGDAPEDRERFLAVIRSHLSQWPGKITATLRGLRHFDNADATVAYDSVRFDADVAGLRSSLIAHLSDNGFPSTDRSPVRYFPHVTLAYLPPNSVGAYGGPVPVGSWTFDEVEVWGLEDDPVVLPLGGVSVTRVAARYKSKKKIETKDGDEATVYEYSDRQVANRHREKAERVEHLRNHITDLRARVKDDLKSDDPMTRMTALAVSLMDHTCERVGNDDSADDGHYGVTGWLKKHITIRDGKATIKYVGKSGVDHEKTVDDGPTVTALKELCEGLGKEDAIFDTDDAKVSADEVNDYLAEFDVTAKDIRGFRANDEMCKALRAERAKGPKELPRARKEKDEILKAEFKRALETVAEVVGHEAATLRSQYLVPGLEDQYVHDGTVLKSLKVGTKTEAQREDEATEKLVKPAPKAKPPRHDLRNERVEAEGDPDLDDTDDDLSLNFKKVAGIVRAALFAGMSRRVLSRSQSKVQEFKKFPTRADTRHRVQEFPAVDAKAVQEESEFQKYVEGEKFRTNKSDREEGVSFSYLEKIDPQAAKKVRKDWGKKRTQDTPQDSLKNREKKQKELSKPSSPEQIQKLVEEIQSSESAKAMTEGDRENVSNLISSVMDGQSGNSNEKLNARIEKYNAESVEKLKGGTDRKTVDALRKVPEGLYGKGVKMTTFDSKKSGDAIAKKQKARDKIQKDLEQAKRDGESLPSEIERAKYEKKVKEQELKGEQTKLKGLKEGTPEHARRKSRVSTLQAAIEKLDVSITGGTKKRDADEKLLPALKASLDKETSELNAMTAYHVSQEHLSSRLTDMSSLKSDSPSERLSEASKHLQALPPEMRDKSIERSKARRDEKKKELDNASSDEERAALQKEVDLADAELAAGTHDKYLRMDEREADEDPKASLFRSLNDRGIGVNDPHVQTLLHEKANQADAAKAVRNLSTELSDEELSELSKKSSTLGHAYESLKDSPFLAQMLREMIVEEMVGEFQKGRAKGKSDKGKPRDAEKVKELAEAAKDLPEKDRETVKKVVREKAKDLPAADRETVEDIVDLDIPDASSTSTSEGGKQKQTLSLPEYRQMLLDGAKDADARRKTQEMSSEDLKKRWESYKAGKTAGAPLPESVARRFLSYSRRGR